MGEVGQKWARTVGSEVGPNINVKLLKVKKEKDKIAKRTS